MREAVAKELGLTTIEDQTMAIRSFGAAAPLTKTLKLTSLELRGTAPNAKSIIISGLVMESISVAQPYLQTEYADLLRRSGKWLADDRTLTEDSRELEVDVLMGMDYLWQVCHSSVKTSNCGLRAMNSIFGWLITGVTNSSEAGKYSAATTMLINCTETMSRKTVTANDEFKSSFTFITWLWP